MAIVGFFSNVIEDVDGVLDSFYNTNVQEIMQYVAPLIGTCATILVIGVGISLMNGWSQDKSKTMLMACFTIVLVSTLAGSVAHYNLYLGNFLRGLPDELLTIFFGGSGNAGAALDSFGDAVLGGIGKMWENASGIAEAVLAAMFVVLFFIAWLVMSVAALFILLTIKIVLTILVTLGPIFILFLIFPQTKDYFTKWLTYAISFCFLAVIVGGILGVAGNIATNYFNVFLVDAENISFYKYAPPALVLFSLIKLFESAPSLASSLTGGIGLSVGSMASNLVAKAARPITSGASKAAGAAKDKLTNKSGRDAKKQIKQEQVHKTTKRGVEEKAAMKEDKQRTKKQLG